MNKEIYPKMFLWLFIGLLVTFGTGFYVCQNANMLYNIANMWWLFVIIELFAVIYLSTRIQKMKYSTAVVYYLLYSFVTGLTFSSIFVVFNISSIILTFGVTAIIFALFAAIGYFTKIDLSKLGSMLFMALIGIILMSLVNLFMHNDTFDLIISCLGILIFVGYTAYDIQKVKHLSNYIDEQKLPIYGALQLYLDFINIFLYLLRIFGRSND